MTDVRFDGIGSDGFGRFCIAASACCTASCRTSVNSVHNISATGKVFLRKYLQFYMLFFHNGLTLYTSSQTATKLIQAFCLVSIVDRNVSRWKTLVTTEIFKNL